MRYRVGLDLGTASVGLAAYEIDETGSPVRLVHHGVRIFDEPVQAGSKGQLETKAAQRRLARQQRRQIDRRASRLRRIVRLAELLGIDPRSFKAPRNTRVSPTRLLELRAQAANRRIELDELMSVFLRLAKRRGYAGDFTAKKSGEVADGSRALHHEMQRVATEIGKNDIFLGEYLLWRTQQAPPLPVKLKARVISQQTGAVTTDAIAKNLYALRRDVEREFNRIWDVQEASHPTLSGTYHGKPLRQVFADAIFGQRPLKSAAGLVGRCPLEPTLPRAPRAQPAFQVFRIEKVLADLRWGGGRRAAPLTASQKQIVRDLCDLADEVSFETIKKAFAKNGVEGPEGKELNLERGSRDVIRGNKTNAAMKRLGILDDWRALAEGTRISVINFLADLGSPDLLDDAQWHLRFPGGKDGKPREFPADFRGFIERLRQTGKYDTLAGMKLDGGRSAYSVKALRRLTEWLRDPSWPGNWTEEMRLDEEMAVRICYPKAAERPAVTCDRLGSPPATGNAVVDKSLRQLKWMMNRAIDTLGGPPAEIVVEMVRDMGLGVSRRNERSQDLRKNTKARNDAAKEIDKHGRVATPARIRRYLLWQEQGMKCPYCTRAIGIEEALSGDATEYEHILPRKLTQVGLKTSEIILAHHDCNQRKRDRTPWMAHQGGDVDWNAVESMAAYLVGRKRFRKAKLLLLKDYEEEVLTDESVSQFADRQFHASAWVAREAVRWLSSICPNGVMVSRGELTANLRRHWKLDTVIPDVRLEEGYPLLDDEGRPIAPDNYQIVRKMMEGHAFDVVRKEHPGVALDRRPDKRIDNRHHLVDAMVIGLVSRPLFAKVARDYKRLAERAVFREEATPEERERAVRFQTRRELPLPPPPLVDLRSAALEAVRRPNLTRKTDQYPQGAFFKDAALSRQRGGPDKTALVKREWIADFGGAEREATVPKVRSAIERIESDEIREFISREFEARIERGDLLQTALRTPFLHPVFHVPIKRVRCIQRQNDVSTAYRVEHVDKAGRRHWKYVIHEGSVWLDLWPGTTNGGTRTKVERRLCRAVEANSPSRFAVPAGGKRFFKGDVVVDSKSGVVHRVCQLKEQGVVVLPLIEPRSFKVANEKAEKGAKIGAIIAHAEAFKRLVHVV